MQRDTRDLIRQSGVVPCRFRKQKAEFCLITSRKGRWGFPKGIIDPGETAEQTALKEACEEAGLDGRIDQEPLGSYRYRKWGTELEVTVYLMEVTSADDRWDEDDFRDRRWCDAVTADQLLHRDELREMLAAAVERLDHH